jgi:tetratricopeptide (TPR) repeat protein
LIRAFTLVPMIVALLVQSAPLDQLESRVTADPEDLRAANEYRLTVITATSYDRALNFFNDLTAKNPDSANAHLNYGFAYVDKIPAAGAISQVILANSALTEFTRSLEIRPSWIGYYTRGVSYLYWPKIFDRTRLGVADLEAALKIQQADERHGYHVRTFVALGDGYWIMDDAQKARAAWRAGLKQFPDAEALKQRLAAKPAALKTLMNDTYDPSRRVDTDLSALWSS